MESDEYDTIESDSKRRRLRKGTHSCWECKRRKVRCTLASLTDTTCISCRRRGKKCVSQELPEEPSQTEDNSERMLRVEALLDQLVKKIDHNDPHDGRHSVSGTDQGHTPPMLTPASDPQTVLFSESNSPSLLNEVIQTGITTSEEHPRINRVRPIPQTPTFQTLPVARSASSNAGKYEKISQDLFAAFPLKNDTNILIETCNATTMFCHKVNNEFRSEMTQEKLQDTGKLGEVPAPGTHPVLLAKYMLMWASLILQLPPQQHIPRLSEHHRIIMERLADTAISLVTTNEKFLGTVEGLDCILLEGLYHLNCGNIRRSWLAHRRAMVAAELIGICRQRRPPVKTLDPNTKYDPQSMWTHILFMDRFLSLLLSLPQGHSQANLECELALAGGTPSDKLERLHSVIAAKILERNLITPPSQAKALSLTFDIDKELRKAADGMPNDFWRPPSFNDLEKNSLEAFHETMRIKDQMFHYTLLNQLHLPYLLCPNDKNEYSRISCVYASRETMKLFITFRSFNSASACCRMADFIALIGGMTLILAHLGSHRRKGMDNLLTHQRVGDRATIELALKHMEVSSKLNEDMLEAKCAALLQHLLCIEAEAARAHNGQALESHIQEARNELHITVPYFGALTIGRSGISFTNPNKTPTQGAEGLEGDITIGGIGSIHVADQMALGDQVQLSTSQDAAVGHTRINFECPVPHQSHAQLEEQRIGMSPMLDGNPRLPNVPNVEDFLFQQDFYPDVAAGVDDWVFQGIDGAFFDRVLLPTDIQAGIGGGTADWPDPVAGDNNLGTL